MPEEIYKGRPGCRLNPFIPQKYGQLIIQKIKEIGGMKLKPIKDALPDEVDYMAIKAAMCKIRCAKKADSMSHDCFGIKESTMV